MFGQCINIFWDKDPYDIILPKKYDNLNLNYKLLDSADYIVRVSDGKKMIKNRYEGYTRGETDYTKPHISVYKTKETYKDHRYMIISKMFVYTITIALL